MNPGEIRPLRWHGGDPDEEQPDAGDVLFEDHGERIYLVRHARQLTRGPDAGTPTELRLLVELGHVGHLSPPLLPEGATVFECTRRRGR